MEASWPMLHSLHRKRSDKTPWQLLNGDDAPEVNAVIPCEKAATICPVGIGRLQIGMKSIGCHRIDSSRSTHC